MTEPRKVLLPTTFDLPEPVDPKEIRIYRVPSLYPTIPSLRFEFFAKDVPAGMRLPHPDECRIVYEALDFTDRLQPHLVQYSNEPVTINNSIEGHRGLTPDVGAFQLTPARKYDYKYDPCLDA
jgi:hypothetical protein